MQLWVPHVVLFSLPIITSQDKHFLCFFICIVISEDSGLSTSHTLLFLSCFAIHHLKLKSHTLNNQVCIKSLCLTFNSIQVEHGWGPFRLLGFTQTVLCCFRLKHSNWQCPIIWDLSGFKYKVASSFFEGYFCGKALNLVFCGMCHLTWLPLVYPFGNNPDPSCSKGCWCPNRNPCFEHFGARGLPIQAPAFFCLAGKAHTQAWQEVPAPSNPLPVTAIV